MVVDGLSDGVIVLDTYDRIVDFNPAARHLFPDLDGEALGRPVSEILAFHPGLLESIGHADDSAPDTVVAELSMALPGDAAGGDLPESRHFTLALTAVRTRGGRVLGHSVLLHDVTRSVELLRQVERLATTDPLTELLTRKAFLELGEREMTRARRQGFPMWLVKLDLDHFALVNDLYGSDAGDEVIRAVAGACRRILRAFDLVGRFGGEEFVMLLPHLSAEEAEEIAEQAAAGRRGPRRLQGRPARDGDGQRRPRRHRARRPRVPQRPARAGGLRPAARRGRTAAIASPSARSEWGAAGPDGRARRPGGEQGP